MGFPRSHLALAGAFVALWVAGCAGDGEPLRRTASKSVAPAPVVTLTEEDRSVWRTAGTGRARIPVLLYHGVAERDAFANQADAFYALATDDYR